MARFACLLVLCVCVACGAAPLAPAPARADAVLLVQIDGLSAAVLDTYRRRPASQGADRLLARLGGARTTALADIGVTPATAAATLIAEATPATLTENTPVLFDLLPGIGIAAGFPAGKRGQAIEVDTDAARVAAVLAAPPAQLVAVRLTGLAEAQATAGISASHDALATIDGHLAKLRAQRPNALLIVVGTGAASRTTGHDQTAEKFAQYLKVDAGAVRPFGGALRVDGLDVAGVAALDSIDFTLAVFHRTADGVQVFDHDLKALRAAHAQEFPTLPHLLQRLDRALSPGDTLALVDRAEGFDFQVGALPAKVARGGAPRAESSVPILFEGSGVRGSADGIKIGDVAGLIQAALAGVKSPAWTQLSTRPARACADAEGCASIVERTESLQAAADALVVAKAYDAARWIDPAVPLPADESADPPARVAATRYAFEDEPRGFTPVDIEVPSAAHAAMIARVLGADVVAWRDSVIAPTPYIKALGGPAFFSGPLAHADDYAAYARGVRAVRQGDVEGGYAELAKAKGHTPDAEAWRGVLVAFAGRAATTVDEAPEDPADLRGWPRVVSTMLQMTDGDDEVVLPPLPNNPTTEQKALYAAFKARAPQTLPCSQIDARTQIDALRDSQATFEAAGLPDFAGRAAVERAYLQADLDAAKASIRAALALSRQPAAAPARAAILSRVLLTTASRPELAAVIDAELDAAATAQLLWIQAQIAFARAQGGDGATRLMSLVDGVAISRRSDLLTETLDFAIAGKSETAAAVVQSLLASGGLASLLQPNAIRQLQVTLFLMERALQTVKPGDGPNERVARAMPPIVRAVMLTLQGGVPQARQTLADADAMLPLNETFAAREAAVRAAGEDGDPAIAAWGPLTKALIVTGRLIGAIMADDLKDGEAHAVTLIELMRRYAHAELGRAEIKGFKAPVDALAKMLVELARYAMLSEDARKAPAATARILKAARAFPLDAPDAGPEVRPWLRLAGVAVHDVAWVLAGQKADMLDAPRAAMDALVASWKPESQLGTAGLFLLLATQHALPDLGALLEADDKSGALQALPRVRSALQTVVKAVRDQYPVNTTVEALRADKAERVFIEHILKLLEDPALFSGDGLVEAMATNNALLRAAAGGTRGDVRDILLMLEAVFAEIQGQHDAALRWSKTGADSPAGPAFSKLPGLWAAFDAGVHARAANRKAAIASLKAAQAACPAATHRFLLATAVNMAAMGDTHGAKKAFKAARLASRRANNGGIDTIFNLNVQDDVLILQTTVQTPLLGTILGRSNGSLQLGAGGTSNAGNARTVRWRLEGESTPSDAVVEALALEAWLALNRGDHATAGTALSGVTSLLFGIDPRHLDGTPATDLPAMPKSGLFFPRSTRLLLWTAVLAEQHGFRRLAGGIVEAIARNSEADWEDPPGGRITLCEGEAPESASDIVKKVYCEAPAPLVHLMGGEEPARAMEAFVRARVGLVDLTAPRQALADAVPTAMPRSAALGAVEAVYAGVDAEKTIREAIEAGFACELLHVDRPAVQARLIGEAHVCGPLPMRIGLAQAAVAEGNATTILEMLRDGLRIEHAMGSDGRFAQGAWPLARSTMSAAPERARLAQRAATWRDLARELERPVEAAWFEALRLASAPTPAATDAEKALIAAWKAGLRAGPALKFFKHVMAGNSAIGKAELLP